jgi:Tol biopolymer transport system component
VTRALRIALVLLLATSILVVIPGEGDATVPGGIGRIVFSSDADELESELYVRDFAGSSPTRITFNADSDYLPSWSPDGSRIAFCRPVVGGAEAFVIDPDGSNEAQLTYGPGSVNCPYDWSPDGKKILIVSDRAGTRDVWVMYADGSSPQQLTNTAHMDEDPVWSPDGSTIAFARDTGSSVDVWLMEADGTNQRNITNRAREDGSPAWSPDGTKIAYTSTWAGDLDIWVMDADGSNPTNLTNAVMTLNSGPKWSPDGSKIAFQSNRDGDWDIWMMSPDGTDVGHLTNNPADEAGMSWESVNRAPVAVADRADVRRSGTVAIDVLGNDSDPDGEPLQVVDITRAPVEGTVAIDAAGNTVYVHGGSAPPPGQLPPYTDSFEYEIEDARMGSARATVTVSIWSGFDDVPESHTFFDDINWLANQGITLGCNPPDNNLYCPNRSVTRGQMAAFLVRALHYTAGGGDNLFMDDDGSVFEIDIDKLGTAGVTKGCNPPVNDHFCPGQAVTRGQMAAFLARAFKLTNLGQVDLFVDDNGSVFELEIDKLGATGISRGCNPPVNDRFCPSQLVTRAQMAAFIRRAVDYIT